MIAWILTALTLRVPTVLFSPPPGATAETVAVATLQGLVNRKAASLWLETTGVQESILGDVERRNKVERTSDIWSVVESYRGQIKGGILYKLGTHSLNVAAGLCGPLKAVAIDESLQAQAKAHGLPIILDVRDLTEQQAFSKYHHLYRKGFVVEQSIDKPVNLRDFAVKHDSFVMDTRDREFRKRVVRDMGPGALVLGWGRDEYQWISDISQAGGTGVAADWCVNLSALEALPAKIVPPRFVPAKNEDGVRYVAFVLSDGDNVQWLTGGFATDPKFYASPLRGTFPMTWQVSPLLSRFAPSVLAKIYADAKPNDDFVTGPGLPGYMFPHASPDRDRLARQSAPFLRDSELRTIAALNENEGSMQEVFPWLDLPEVGGEIYADYAPYNRRQGELVWRAGKPCLAYRFLLWDGLTAPNELAKSIADMPAQPRTSLASYALVCVHAWSFGSLGGPIEAIRRVIEKLPPNTRVVTANELLDLLARNLRRRSQD